MRAMDGKKEKKKNDRLLSTRPFSRHAGSLGRRIFILFSHLLIGPSFCRRENVRSSRLYDCVNISCSVFSDRPDNLNAAVNALIKQRWHYAPAHFARLEIH